MNERNRVITRTIPKTYRHAFDTLEAIETYSTEEGVPKSRALDELVGYGVLIWLNKRYNEKD